MKPWALCLCLLLAPLAALAADSGASADDAYARREISKALLSGYHYTPHPENQSTTPSFMAHSEPQAESQILLNPAEWSPGIKDSVHVMYNLDAAIAQEEIDAHNAAVARKLGIGVSSVALGGNFTARAATAFYVPVALGVVDNW